MSEALPLSDVKVVDASVLVAGGLISTVLADYGADVIKLEHPQFGDRLRDWGETSLKTGWSSWWTVYSRNKKSVTLNLSLEKGQRLLKQLLKDADVFIENFRPGTLERWNLSYEELAKVNPRLIVVRVSAFGQTGPLHDRPGFGTIAECISGFAHITGLPDGPPTLPSFPLADGVAGMVGSWAVMIALYHRDVKKQPQGQVIDLSLYEPLFMILGPQTTDYQQLGVIQNRVGNRVPFAAPRNAYKTADGKWVALSGTTQATAERVFKAIGRPELIQDPKFKDNRSRVENVDELDAIIGDWIKQRPLEEVLKRFDADGVAGCAIYDTSQILADPQFTARESVTTVLDPALGEVKMQNVFPKLSRTPGKIRWTGPPKGAHNREIYIERLGLSEEELDALTKEGVI